MAVGRDAIVAHDLTRVDGEILQPPVFGKVLTNVYQK